MVISTDAHSPGALADMKYGIGVARRAWLEPRDVLNTLPADELVRTLRARRRGG